MSSASSTLTAARRLRQARRSRSRLSLSSLAAHLLGSQSGQHCLILSDLLHFYDVGELLLNGNEIDGRSLASCVELLPSMQHFNVTGNPFNASDEGAALVLAKALSRHLTLIDVTVGGVVVPLRADPAYTEDALDLSDSRLTSGDGNLLHCLLGQRPSLKRLAMPVDPFGCELCLNFLAAMPQLHTLQLDRTLIDWVC